MTTRRLHLKSHEEALSLFGPNDEYLRDLERRYHVQFFIRPSTLPSGEGLTLAIRGKNPQIDKAITALEHRLENPAPQKNGQAVKGYKKEDVPPEKKGDTVIRTATGQMVTARTETQKTYVEAMGKNDMVFAVGPAGTGKTFLAVAFALSELQQGNFAKIVLTRPVVEAGEKLGFLPGDFYEKVHPYLRPLYDAFYTIVGPDRFRLMREDEIVEIVPLAYMRGRTLDNAVIILDEAQNTTPEQMKMFLTRMGQNSKVVVNGDLTQIDLENKSRSGLLVVEKILKDVKEIKFIRFKGEDVVRHALVKKILSAYEEAEKKKD